MIQKKFTGGIAEGSREGYEGAVFDAIGIDYMSDPDKLQVAKQLVKNSGSTVTDLVLWHAEFLGNDYFYGNSGKIYRRNASATWSNPKTVSNSSGNGISVFNEELWYAGDETLGKTTDIDQVSPTFYDNYLKSLSTDSQAYNETGYAGSNTYQLQTSITETSTHRYTFTATIDNVRGVTIHVISKGTGDITCTLHDTSNNKIAAVTIATASVANGVMFFEFDGAYPITVGNSYHIHITVSTGTTTIKSSASNDHETIAISILNDQINTDNDQSATVATFSSSNSYTLPTALTEGAINRQDFIPDKEMLAAVSVMINSFSATNLTLTLVVHDENHASVASATLVTSAAKRSGVYNKFEFTDPVKLVVGATYHFHLYTSSGTVTVWSSTNSDFNTVYFKTHTAILVDADYHMMKVHTNLLCIGNGNYLATLDDSEVYNPERLKFPIGESVRCLETIGDYLAISTTRGDIDDYGEGRVYFWDGIAEVFNAFVDIDGQVNSMINDSNKLMILHGTEGQISYYTGAVTKVRKLKYANAGAVVEFFPGAIDTYEGVVYFGPGTVSGSVTMCVYSYGKKDKDYPTSLNKPYPISTGVKTSDAKIGMIKGVSANKFFVSWQSTSGMTTTYGVDLIDNTKKQTYADFTTLRDDSGKPNIEKKIKSFSVRCSPLAANQKITVKYDIDNSGNFVTLGTMDYDGNTLDRGIVYKSFPAPTPSRFFDIQYKIIIENDSSDGTAPDILVIALEDEEEPQIQIGRK
jgi:hypothetical protein